MTQPANLRLVTEGTADSVIADQINTPGSATQTSLSATFATLQRGMLTIVIGDSIDIGSDDATYKSNSGSWFSRSCVYSGSKMRFLRNAGVAGNTTAQALARFDTDVTAHSPAVSCKVNFSGASASFSPIKDWTEALTGVLFYMEAVVPSGTTTLQIQITANTAAGSFQFAQVGIVNLTTLGLA